MDEDAVSEVAAFFPARLCAVLSVGVVDAHGEVVGGVGIEEVDGVDAFGDLFVAAFEFGSEATACSKDGVGGDECGISVGVGCVDFEESFAFERGEREGGGGVGCVGFFEEGAEGFAGFGSVLFEAGGDGAVGADFGCFFMEVMAKACGDFGEFVFGACGVGECGVGGGTDTGEEANECEEMKKSFPQGAHSGGSLVGGEGVGAIRVESVGGVCCDGWAVVCRFCARGFIYLLWSKSLDVAFVIDDVEFAVEVFAKGGDVEVGFEEGGECEVLE